MRCFASAVAMSSAAAGDARARSAAPRNTEVVVFMAFITVRRGACRASGPFLWGAERPEARPYVAFPSMAFVAPHAALYRERPGWTKKPARARPTGKPAP